MPLGLDSNKLGSWKRVYDFEKLVSCAPQASAAFTQTLGFSTFESSEIVYIEYCLCKKALDSPWTIKYWKYFFFVLLRFAVATLSRSIAKCITRPPKLGLLRRFGIMKRAGLIFWWEVFQSKSTVLTTAQNAIPQKVINLFDIFAIWNISHVFDARCHRRFFKVHKSTNRI